MGANLVGNLELSASTWLSLVTTLSLKVVEFQHFYYIHLCTNHDIAYLK